MKKKKVSLQSIVADTGISYNSKLPEFTIGLKTKAKPSELHQIACSADIEKVCREIFEADKIDWIEQFVVIAISQNNRVLGFFKMAAGGITGVVADPKVALQFALLSNARQLILCHNHPSGSLKPSRLDEELTQKMKTAAQYLDIKVLDHIIITSEGYYSFADEGLM